MVAQTRKTTRELGETCSQLEMGHASVKNQLSEVGRVISSEYSKL